VSATKASNSSRVGSARAFAGVFGAAIGRGDEGVRGNRANLTAGGRRL
jgi:hypothetical protein